MLLLIDDVIRCKNDVIMICVVKQVRGLNKSGLTNWHIPLCIWIARIAKIKVGWIIIKLNRDYRVNVIWGHLRVTWGQIQFQVSTLNGWWLIMVSRTDKIAFYTGFGQSGRSEGFNYTGPKEWKWTLMCETDRSFEVDGLRKVETLHPKTGP